MSSLLVALVLAAVPVPQAHPREVPVAVYTKKELPVEDLQVGEIEVKEDGKKRTVLAVEPDERPVDVALILDSSQQIEGEYRASLVPAAMNFWKRLPAHSRLTIWTCGGKVSHAVEFGTEPEAGETTLQMVAVGGPVFALDTLIDASRHLQKAGAERRVVVLVTDATIQANQTLINRAYAAVARTRVTPMIVLIKGTVDMGQDWDTETIFERMAEGYGGSYARSLSPSAAHKWLARAAADISSQYRVRYESEATEPLRPEVKVKRKNVQVRAGLAEIVN